jgi:beta-xylosidase
MDVLGVHGFPLDWNRWPLDDWSTRVAMVRDVAQGKPVWATEVGVSSFVAPALQAWGLDRTLQLLTPVAERVYWYALMDLPDVWEAVTRHRGSEGSAYYRHFRMGLFEADGTPKPAADHLRVWLAVNDTQVGVCEWVYWQEPARLARMVEQLKALGVRRVRTGLGWADWDREGAEAWFDHVMEQLTDFDVTLTLCFTPQRAGRRPHHTSPPVRLADYADFCESVVRRYVVEPASPKVPLSV